MFQRRKRSSQASFPEQRSPVSQLLVFIGMRRELDSLRTLYRLSVATLNGISHSCRAIGLTGKKLRHKHTKTPRRRNVQSMRSAKYPYVRIAANIIQSKTIQLKSWVKFLWLQDIQSSKRNLPNVLILEQVRRTRSIVSIAMSEPPTPPATAANEGGSMRFEVWPAGGGSKGILVRSRPDGS